LQAESVSDGRSGLLQGAVALAAVFESFDGLRSLWGAFEPSDPGQLGKGQFGGAPGHG